MSLAAPCAASPRSRPAAAAVPLTAPSPFARHTTRAPLATAPLWVMMAEVAPPAMPTGPRTLLITGTTSWLGTPAVTSRTSSGVAPLRPVRAIAVARTAAQRVSGWEANPTPT